MKTIVKSDILDLDTIIKSIEEEFMLSNNKEKWEVPKYSGNQINKAGKIIADPFSTSEERKKH